jgi:hypothetical protein
MVIISLGLLFKIMILNNYVCLQLILLRKKVGVVADNLVIDQYFIAR